MSSRVRFRLHPLAAAGLLAVAQAAGAQSAPSPAAPAAPPAATPSAAAPQQVAAARLPTVVITGNPLGAQDLIAPVEAVPLDGQPQNVRTTLGDTLDGLPGVSATYFGPNSNRPVVRGLDGDRIRILDNGGASIDASALSYDHAVPIAPIAIDRVEVLRGPGALLYGGSATGGVVNVIDGRIPTEPIKAVEGRADLAAASGNRERSGALRLDGGNGRIGLHVDAFDTRTSDVAVPIDLPCTAGGEERTQRRICNSASHTRGGALGGTVFFDQGYLGLSSASYRSSYGTVAEDDVSIGMKSTRTALEGLWRLRGGPLESLKLQMSHGNYRHTEFENGEPGTTFRNRGDDLRLEARHRAMAGFEGVIGLQLENTRFSADGEEVFAPPSRTRSRALFVYEERPTTWGKWSAGARLESVRVRSLGMDELDRFFVGERSFAPRSLSLGVLARLGGGWEATASLAHTERAPKDYELFANGPHVATAAWETGDPALGLEKSNSLDLGAQWKSGAHRFKLNAWHSRFSNFIGLLDSGNTLDDLPEQVYRGVRARLWGLEASGNVRLVGAGGVLREGMAGGGVLDLKLRADLVRADNLSTGEPLPRIAPARLGATLAYAAGPLSAQFGFDHAAAQTRVPTGSRATSAYTLWNAGLNWRQTWPKAELVWFARLDNLTNQLAYSATSILTSTAYPKAPLPGRSLRVGVQASF